MISISVVSGSSEKNLDICLDSLTQSIKSIESKIIVTDNCSKWDVGAVVKKRFPDAEIIKNEVPAGFGSNHNNALLGRNDDFALVINDDLEFRADTINQLLILAGEKENGAIFGPILYPGSWDDGFVAAGGTLGERLPKPILHAISMNLRALFGDKFIKRYLTKRDSSEIPKDEAKAYISGACCLIRRSFIQKHSLYDPEYYMYFDDIDLGKRAREAGWECWQSGKAAVLHREGGSFSSNTWKWMTESNLRYVRKYHGILVYLLCKILLAFLKVILFFKKRKTT